MHKGPYLTAILLDLSINYQKLPSSALSIYLQFLFCVIFTGTVSLIDWETSGVFYAAYDIATYFLGLIFTGKE